MTVKIMKTCGSAVLSEQDSRTVPASGHRVLTFSYQESCRRSRKAPQENNGYRSGQAFALLFSPLQQGEVLDGRRCFFADLLTKNLFENILVSVDTN